jgi:hypothetical protein
MAETPVAGEKTDHPQSPFASSVITYGQTGETGSVLDRELRLKRTAGGLKPTLLENTKNVASASGRANNQPKYKTLKKAEQSRAG